MKRLLAIILAALMMCALFATAAWADGELYSDEIGDYYLYENGAVKAYVRLNREAVDVHFVGSGLGYYDLNGNEIILSDMFDDDAHPWIREIIDEYVRQNTEYDENGDIIIAPEVGIPGRYHDGPDIEIPIEEIVGIDETDMMLENEARQPMYDENGVPMEGSEGYYEEESLTLSAPTSPKNPNTGIAFAVTPAVLAFIALIFKKR